MSRRDRSRHRRLAVASCAHACIEARLLDATRRRGGYSIPQGSCPAGHGQITDVALSTRYNDLAFTCSGGGLYPRDVGPK